MTYNKALKIILVVGLLFSVSCSKEDGNNIKELYAYINPDFQPGSAYRFDMKIIQTPNKEIAPDNADQKLPPLIRLTRPVSSEVTVNLSIDSSLLSQYNEPHNTSYQLAPKEAYEFNNGKGNISAIVKSGEMSNKDSLPFKILKPKVFVDSNHYVIPIRLESANGGAQVSKKVGMLLIIPHTEVIFTNINEGAEVPSEVELIDRTNPAWQVTVSNDAYGSGDNMLDSDYGTSWMGSAGSTGLIATIDMGATYDLKGIELSPNYNYSVSYNLDDIEIFTSVDGSDWISQGTYQAQSWGGSTSNPDVRDLIFYSPVNAQYLRLVLNGNSYFGGFSEVKAYE